MAEPIGVASGLLALTTFAIQSSITLYQTIQSFKSHTGRVRDLLEELDALSGILGTLAKTVSASIDVDLSALHLPLLRCGNACRDFEQELIKCSSRSNSTRTSFRDWAKLTYMGDNIDGFKHLLAGYKSTINIALADANLRKSAITSEDLKSYKNLIKTATDDLETHLQNMDEKLEAIFGRTVTDSDSDATELRLLKEERLSTQKCLQICAQLSDHINEIQIRPTQRSRSSSGALNPEAVPEQVVNKGLQECRESLKLASAKLESHMQDLIEKLITKSKNSITSEEELADLVRLREQWEATRQCMDICSKADNHLNDSVSIIDNYAEGDETIQFLVSTDGKTLNGKNRGHGARIKQLGGHLNDTSLQQISRDFVTISLHNTGDERLSSRDSSASIPDETTHDNLNSEFGERYGRGFKLTSKSTTNVAVSSKP